MLWLHLIYTLLMYSKMCAATFSMNSFMKIANLEFTQIPIHLFCGISVINCASKCDTDVGCLAFNYNRGTRTCRLMSFNPFDMTVWPDLAYSDEWDTYTNQEPSGNINWSDVQRKNVVNNVDMLSLRTPSQNGPYKIKHTEQYIHSE